MRKFIRELAVLGLLVSLAGCAHSDKCRPQGDSACQGPLVVLPVVQRAIFEALIQGLPSTPIQEAGKEPDRTYRALTPDLCRCLAAKTSGTGNMLDDSADSIEEDLCKRCLEPSQEKKRQAALKQDILRSTALEQRNTDSAIALGLYYSIFEEEGLADLQRESISVVAGELARTRDLRDKGLKSPEDVEALNRRQLELLADLHRLQLGLDELNGELGRRINLEDKTCACRSRFWPDHPFHFKPDPPDCEQAVAEGLASRPELYGLQRMIDELDVKTLAMIRQVMVSFSPLLALADHKPVCPKLNKLIALVFGLGKMKAEVEVKREQLMRHKAERMRIISSEIRDDVATLTERARVIALFRARVASFARRVADVEVKASRGLASAAEVADVKLQWIKARGDVVKSFANWEREYVQLRRHQGLLPAKCHEVLDAPAPEKQPKPAAPALLPPIENQFSSQLSRQLSQAGKTSP